MVGFNYYIYIYLVLHNWTDDSALKASKRLFTGPFYLEAHDGQQMLWLKSLYSNSNKSKLIIICAFTV